MASAKARKRNNTIAGFFVIATIISFLVVVISLSNVKSLGGKKVVEIAFPLDLGVPGLELGSAVSIGQRPVGNVTWIETVTEPDSQGNPPRVVVRATVPKDVRIGADAKAFLNVPLLGSGTTINIQPGSAAPAADGAVIPGDIAISILWRASGIGEAEIAKIQQMIDDSAAITANVREISTFVRERVATDGPQILDDAKATLTDFRTLVADVRAKWPDWSGRADSILSNVDAATAKGPELADQASGLITDARAGVTDVRATFDKVRPNVERIAQNADDIVADFKENKSAALDDLARKAGDILDRAQASVTTVDELLATESPGISRTLGNLRLASDNLKLTTIEVRAAPWKLLQKPAEGELKESELYAAVRTYASALSDLEASSEALKAMHDRYGADLPAESQTLSRILQQLDERMSQYKDAEATLFSMLLGEREVPGVESLPRH